LRLKHERCQVGEGTLVLKTFMAKFNRRINNLARRLSLIAKEAVRAVQSKPPLFTNFCGLD